MLSGATTLAEAYPGRLILGPGGHRTRDQQRGYLDALTTDVPGPYVPRVLAALGPRVLEPAAERTAHRPRSADRPSLAVPRAVTATVRT